MQEMKKITSALHPDITLKLIPGHFITPNSHINYYLDMTTLKCRYNEAEAVARAMSTNYSATTVVDTIVCLEDCQVIGTCLAQDLTRTGVLSMNAHKSMYILSPEYNNSGLIIFRENNIPMVREKNILLLLASATTGGTILKAASAINYYGGRVVGVSAIFSAVNKIKDIPIHSIFSVKDVPDYRTYAPENCVMCKDGVAIDAFANGYGYSRI